MKHSKLFVSTYTVIALICLFNVDSIFSQTNPRKFYKYDVIATTNSSLDVFAAPSINDFGDVAFAGRKTPGGGTVFLNEIGGQNVDLMPSFSANASQIVGGRVQINNGKQVIQHTFVTGTTPAQNFLRRINGVDDFTLIAAANGAGSFNDFNQIYPSSIGMNNAGESVFLARNAQSTTILATGIRPDFSLLQFPSTGDSLRPSISDCGFVAVRAGASPTDPIRIYLDDFSEFDTIASTADGFTALGQSPAISNFCEVVTFYGDLNQTGADALGTNPGPGIFASIEIDKAAGTRRIVRLAGRLIENISAPGGNDDGYCDPGETCMQGELGFNQAGNPIFFNSFDALNRIAVTHQSIGATGIEDDIFVVSFLATPNIASDNPQRPFSSQQGLWTLTTQVKNELGTLREKPSVAVPVIQLGDTVNTRTVTGINVFDQLASVRTVGSSAESPGDHRLAFHVTTNNGNMILRAKRKVDVPVVFIPGIAGSVLAERQGTTFVERWPGGMDPDNFQHLSLAPGEERQIEALGALKRVTILGAPVMKVYESLLDAMTSGAGGLTEYKVEDKPERRTFDGCDVVNQATAQPNLFVFAYDWRKSNSENATKLREYVRCIQRFYPETEVDIVAHSMGGLLARNYILSFPANHSVRKMVTIGSPYLGAPKSLKVLEDGSFLEPWASYATAALRFRLTGANSVFKQLVPRFEGPHELLPSEKYFDLGGKPFSENFDFNNDGIISVSGYDYATTRDTFNARFPTLPYERNRAFHQGAQDDWQGDSSGVEYFQLFGRQIERKTPEQVVAKKRVFAPRLMSKVKTRFDVVKGFGDKTVPVLSAERIGNGLNLNSPGMVPEPLVPVSSLGETDDDVEHNGLTANERVQEKIFGILGLTAQSVIGSATHQGMEDNMSSNLGEIPQREANYLIIEGDVETLRITDDLGRTNTPINDYFDLSVPEVRYESVYLGEGSDGFYSHDLVLTTQRQYTIKFRTGTNAVNAVTIEMVRGLSNMAPSFAVRYLDQELPPNVECLLTVTGTDMDDLRYDSNGDGTYDVVVPAHKRLSGAAAQDVEAPQVSMSVDPRHGIRAPYVVRINAVDSQSGVGTIYYRLDRDPSFSVYNGSVTVPWTDADRTIEVFADDNAGNRSSPITAVISRL